MTMQDYFTQLRTLRARIVRGAALVQQMQQHSPGVNCTALCAQLDRDRILYCALRRETDALLNAIPKREYQQILKLRYLADMQWEEVSELMHYSLRWVMRLHRKALQTAVETAARRPLLSLGGETVIVEECRPAGNIFQTNNRKEKRNE